MPAGWRTSAARERSRRRSVDWQPAARPPLPPR
jgi:hypothetical protein